MVMALTSSGGLILKNPCSPADLDITTHGYSAGLVIELRAYHGTNSYDCSLAALPLKSLDPLDREVWMG